MAGIHLIQDLGFVRALAGWLWQRVGLPVVIGYLGRACRQIAPNLAVKSRFGVQIVGIERNDISLLGPGPEENLKSGDQLLVLGTPEQVNERAFWLAA